MNTIVISGRLTREAELRYTQGGMAVTNFNIAVDRNMSKAKKQEAEAKGEQTADFINCVAFNKTAEYIANYSRKGGRIAVEGRIQTGSYTNQEGQRVYTTDVIANNVEIIDFKDKDNFSNNGFQPVDNSDIPF